MRSSLPLLALPALTFALPGFMGAQSEDEVLQQLKREAEAPVELEERQILGGLLGNVVDDVASLLGSVAASVDPDNLRPEPGFTFQAPGPGDSRGPCPGLNLLANYGYLPRNGLVNFAQIVEATARGFNMGTDLSTILAVFAILTDGDIETESWYLGSGPGTVGGLNRHSTVEADISVNREDFYLGCGDNHHVSSRIFRQNVGFAAADPGKQFSIPVMAKQYVANSKFSEQYNPWLYYFPFPSIVSVVAFNFYPNYFSNGTYGAGGVPNYESISSIIGAQLNEQTGQFEYVPERWPENWYRRATEYGAVQALLDGFTEIYPNNPVPMPIAQLATPGHVNVSTILCDLVQGLNSITPLPLAGEIEALEAGLSWALGKLAAVGLSETILGCPSNTLSANYPLYPNASREGGPLSPPPSVLANAGNNVYGKTYFCTAPTTPQCSHTC